MNCSIAGCPNKSTGVYVIMLDGKRVEVGYCNAVHKAPEEAKWTRWAEWFRSGYAKL